MCLQLTYVAGASAAGTTAGGAGLGSDGGLTKSAAVISAGDDDQSPHAIRLCSGRGAGAGEVGSFGGESIRAKRSGGGGGRLKDGGSPAEALAGGHVHLQHVADAAHL